MIAHAFPRTLLVLGALLALSGSHSPLAHADAPGPDALARLDRRLARSPRVRILTLAGLVEARGVRAGSEGLTYRDIIASTRPDMLPDSGTLTWNAVLGIDALGTKAGGVAIGTGALVGTVGLLIGFAGGVASPEGEVGSWAFTGAALGFAGGALLGATIGSAMQRWVRVYPSSSPTGAAPQHVATDFDTTASAQLRFIAIAPLANLAKRKDAEQAAQGIREGIFRELTRLSDSRVVVQALAETDRKLREASYSTSAASRLPASEICRLLGTDAVLMGAITRYRQKGAAGNVASLVFLNLGAKGREVEAEIAIYEGANGRLVWRQNVRKATGLLSPSDMLGTAVGVKVAEKFPYRQGTVRR